MWQHTTLFLNNHNGLKIQEILKMLNLFGLKIKFYFLIIFLNVYSLFDLILRKYTNFIIKNLTFSTWMANIIYKLLDYHLIKSILIAHTCISMIG
jgi:hypothetical protein